MRHVVPFIPYLAVALGLYGFDSAWAALGLYHAGMMVAVFILQNGVPRKGELRISALWAPAAACVFACAGPAMYALWPFAGQDSRMITGRLIEYGVTTDVWPYLAVYFCAVNPILEELFWRGRLGSGSRGLTGHDLLFAGYHGLVLLPFASPAWAIPIMVACAFAGWLWRMLRIATGGLAVPIITHAIADVSIALAVHFRAFA